MKASRTAAGLVLLLLIGLALALWTWIEARRQRSEIERALRGEAALLALSLAPGLAAASNALREIDEGVAARLLDNARLIALLARDAIPEPATLLAILEANELDTIAFFDRDGRTRLGVGDALDPDVATTLAPLLAGRVEEVLLAPGLGSDADHRAAAVSLSHGGAVLVHVHAASAYTFARRLGIDSLLRRLVASESVLYLRYREEPGPVAAAASWDDGPLPPPRAEVDAGRLEQVRGRLAFEVTVPVETQAGRRATLRVGLDGDSIERASMAATRRTVLIGVVLAGFGLASTAYALLRRERDRERQNAARRLALAEEARRRSERLALAGALTAGLAHEVRSPLNAIALAAQRLERAHADEGARSFARLVRAEVRRLDGVLREFLDLARPVSDRRERIDLGRLGREVAELLASEAEEAGVEIAPIEGAAEAVIDRDAIRRAVINLVRNAIQASPVDGVVRIAVAADREGTVSLRVADQGAGIPAELGDKVLEPFVTTRADGTGLGLALVRRVAEEHGGEIRLANRSPLGAEAILTMPGRPDLRRGKR